MYFWLQYAATDSLGSLLELVNHLVEIGIACAKAPGEPVSTTLSDSLSVSQYLKLTGLAGRDDGFSTQPLFYQGHETRDLGFVVLSCRARTYLNFHVSSNGMAILSHGMATDRRCWRDGAIRLTRSYLGLAPRICPG